MYQASNYIWALTASAAVGIPGLVAIAVHRGARDADAGGRIGLKLAAGAGVWLVASALFARFGGYGQGARHAAPWFALAIAAPLGGALIATRFPSIARALRAPRMLARLALPHTLRIEGVVFLILWAQGQLPAVFALPAGLGDMAIGISAPFLARRLARSDVSGAFRFNVLGIVDLVVALGIGFFAGIGPVRVFHGAASTLPLSQLPLALIPTVAVPAAIALHVVSLVLLHRQAPVAAEKPTPIAATAPLPA